MGYSTQTIKNARRQLEQQRLAAEKEYAARLQQAYTQVPRIKQIDIDLRKAVSVALQGAFGKPGMAQTIMDDAKTASLALQKEREELVNANFPAGYLDEGICPKCGSTGYIGSTMCSCLEQLCRQEQRRQVSLLSCGVSDFRDFRLDYYPDRVQDNTGINIRGVMLKNYELCRHYAMNFPTEPRNLLFSGDTGLGKTFFSACIASAVTDRGYSVAYESAPHLFAWLEKAKFTQDPDQRAEAELRAGQYTTCDLLIIDDLGTELAGQFVTVSLYTLINDRLLSGKSTIISTNLNSEDLEKRYSPQVQSRLRGAYRRVAFLGDDIRVLKSRGVLR